MQVGWRWKKKHSPWWNDDLRACVKEKTKKLRRWLRHKTLDTRLEYIVARNKVNTEKQIARARYGLNLAEELREDLKQNRKKVFGLAKAYRKPRSNIISIKGENGETLTTPEDINQTWTKYFEDFLNVERGNEIEAVLVIEDEVEDEDEHITEDELTDAMKEMRNDRSPGFDGISVELYKEGGPRLKRVVLHLINEIWKDECIPEDWGKTIIVLLYKGKGDSTKCENYRGIALINHIMKIYERILEKRARAIIEPQLGQEQYGYRKGRSVIDLIFALRMVVEKAWEFNVPIYGAFIDLRKAFDSIPRIA